MLAMLLLDRMNTRRQNLKKQALKSVKIQKNASKDICRTCLSTEDLVSIFYNKENEKKRTEDLRLVTGLEIRINDGLSQKICRTCIETMNTALKFRQSSRKADRKLRSLFSVKQEKKHKYIKTTKVKAENVNNEMVESAENVNNETIDISEVPMVNNLTFEYDFGDDYQVDNHEDDEEMKEVEKKTPLKKKRQVLPNASSYKCATCNKEFRMKATFKAHMRFHTNYCVCESCGKRCRNNNQLQEHKRARHGLTRIHSCGYCEYTSATKEALTIHERRHTGERPYICDYCGAAFHRRSNLVQHIAIHLPDKNFQCSKCPKRLKSRKFLMIHENKAHKEKRYRYICPICEDTFSRPGNVRHHLQRSHNITREQQGHIEKIRINMPVVEEVHKDDAIYVYI